MANRNSYIEFARRLCAEDGDLLESVISAYRRAFIMEDAAQAASSTATTSASTTATAGSTSTGTVPDVVLNTNKLTPDSANVIAKKLIDLANQEEKLSQSKKELQNLSGAAYNGG